MKISDASRCAAKIDLSAIRENLVSLSSLAPGKKVCSVIKADAYGHGACEAAKVLDDLTDVFAVATPDEGKKLRLSGIIKPILLLGPAPASEDGELFGYGLTGTVFEYERAMEANEAAVKASAGTSAGSSACPYAFKDKKAHIHIAVDTGMSRIGLTPDENGLEIIKRIISLPNISVDGIFTHFATADETDKTEANKAFSRFRALKALCVREGINIPLWHAANTASVIDNIALSDDMDMARYGIGLYGMYPSDEVIKANAPLKYAMQWYSFVTYVKDIAPGTSVSYGYTFTAERPMRAATISCGYADGYPRLMSNRGDVLIHGKRCRILGRVCMDQFVVDVTDVKDVRRGDMAVLMGSDGNERITPEEIARITGTINYEITCDVSARVPRLY